MLLFINSRWIDANPALTDQLIANDLFCIGHFNQPGGSTAEGLMQVVPQLKAKGLTFALLDTMTLV